MLPLLTHPVIIYYEREFHPLLNRVMTDHNRQWTTLFPESRYTLVYFPRFWDRIPWDHPRMSAQFRYYQPEYRMDRPDKLMGAKRMLSSPHFTQVLYRGLHEMLEMESLPDAGFILGGENAQIQTRDLSETEKYALEQENPQGYLDKFIFDLLGRIMQEDPVADFSVFEAAESQVNYCLKSPENQVWVPDPEEAFEIAAESAAAEIREKLEKKLGHEQPAVVLSLLVQVLEHVRKGYPEMAYEIEDLLKDHFRKSDRPLSLLQLKTAHAGYDYKILLPDYDLEIDMPRLPKALYLLFLRHPEGIFLHDLPDFQDELLGIYSKIASISDPDVLSTNISRLVDMTDNSVHVNCARIKKAFLSRMDDRIAHYYYVQGKRGERKRVHLPAEFLEIDPVLR